MYFILCALIIGCYTIVGAWGVNLGAGPFAYISWMYFFQGCLMTLIAYRMIQTTPEKFSGKDTLIGLLVGLLAMIAFSTVLWAQTKTQPALVSALREMGIVLSLPAARILFKERVTIQQYLLAIGILCCNISIALISASH